MGTLALPKYKGGEFVACEMGEREEERLIGLWDTWWAYILLVSIVITPIQHDT